jgi:filamentous hemagglutinin
VLTDLKSFMSSDYLLEKLGYDPDQSAKRLGDGLYEQRLIQQAVTARTGQAFIDGQTSNEGMFKYLMNNAIASKDTQPVGRRRPHLAASRRADPRHRLARRARSER